MTDRPTAPQWDPAFFDASYYGQAGRGGFREYQYNSEVQREQLDLKFSLCQKVPQESVLFIGCARGFEVAHWIHKGIPADGVDVSEWAIANQIPEAMNRCQLYNGWDLSTYADKSVALVAAFDVLTMVPDVMLPKLVAEMKRVAARAICFRTVVKNYRNAHRSVDGQDGAWFRYLPLAEWDRLFTEDNQFILQSALVEWSAETFLTFVRVARNDNRLRHLLADR